MGCGCGGAGAGATGSPQGQMNNTIYVHTKPDGTSDSYQSEIEVAAAVSRQGGTYRIGG